MERSFVDGGIARALVLMAGAAVVAGAQAPMTTGTLTGRVMATDGTPLPQAQIAVRGTALAAVAAVDGRFRIVDVPADARTIHVRMLGYAPRSMAVDLSGGKTQDVEVVLTANPLPLEAVEVRSRAALTPGIRGFEERRARGGPGVFLTRADIDRTHARLLTDVLRRVPGLQVRPMRGSMSSNLAVQARGSDCPMRFYMNGSTFPLPSDQTINDFVGPDEVVAIEVYSGSSEVPAQFSVNTRCGVIMLWTRYGPDDRGQRR